MSERILCERPSWVEPWSKPLIMFRRKVGSSLYKSLKKGSVDVDVLVIEVNSVNVTR